MLKDGRRYLVHCTWPTVEAYWEVVRWGSLAGLSDPSGFEGWITNNGFKLRMDNCTFGEFFELDNVIALLRCTKKAGVDYGKSES